MVTRVRTQSLNLHSGYFEDPLQGGVKVPSNRYALTESCTDDVAPGDNRTFLVERYTVEQGLVDLSWNGIDSYVLPVNTQGNSAWKSAVRQLSISASSNSALTTKLIAMTNPSRPEIDLPVFLFELQDIPRLFKIAGDTIFKTVAKSNLAYHFGWKPLVSDLISIVNFGSLVDRRYRELKQLYEKGLRRTVTLETQSLSGNRALAYGVVGPYNQYNVTISQMKTHYSETIRGHIKWKPTSVPPSCDAEMRKQAMRAALGLYANPAAAWEAIPFSWLSDWFLGIGSYLNATRNFIPAVPYDTSIMREIQGSWSCPLNVTNRPYTRKTLIEPTGKYIRKSRTPTSAVPTVDATLPWLSPKQWSILASLYVVKRRGGRSIS